MRSDRRLEKTEQRGASQFVLFTDYCYDDEIKKKGAWER
jgi:hypothetical protein